MLNTSFLRCVRLIVVLFSYPNDNNINLLFFEKKRKNFFVDQSIVLQDSTGKKRMISVCSRSDKNFVYCICI